MCTCKVLVVVLLLQALLVLVALLVLLVLLAQGPSLTPHLHFGGVGPSLRGIGRRLRSDSFALRAFASPPAATSEPEHFLARRARGWPCHSFHRLSSMAGLGSVPENAQFEDWQDVPVNDEDELMGVDEQGVNISLLFASLWSQDPALEHIKKKIGCFTTTANRG